jgi:two-component system chemotaxis response regulator CheY
MPTVDLHELEQLARHRGQPFKVLIVDDEKWVREVFRDFCRLSDAFDVELANTGAEAVEKVKVNKYDLITIDLIMPEMSGLEALNAIKEISPGVPIMVITGNATEKLVLQAGIQGACRVMYKPVVLEDFVAELTSTLVR